MSTPDNKSYLATGLNALSPWGSRSATPKPGQTREDDRRASDAGLGTQQGGDHTVSRTHRLSLKKYPRDCPPLRVQWFHAVDIPKRKPLPSGQPPPTTDKPPIPKKFVPFAQGDSNAIEAAYQKLADEEDAAERDKLEQGEDLGVSSHADIYKGARDGQQRTKSSSKSRVPVNEDYLFDVDIEERELIPAYWLGPVYEVRRGTWFQAEGFSLRACDENLATQLEEGYLKLKPWKFPQGQRSPSQTRQRPTSLKAGDDTGGAMKSRPEAAAEAQEYPKTHRLFGQHMNSVVTYQDATTAWLLTDDFLSRMSSTMYQRFAGGGHFAGIKLVRGYSDPSKRKAEVKDSRTPGTATPASDKEDSDAEGDSKHAKDDSGLASTPANAEDARSPSSEVRRATLERKMSSLVTSAMPESREKQEEEARKRDEKEIRDDYKEQEGDEQGREIEHLILVTHGIGQRLGLRMESVNFVHDVNTLRKTLKAVYAGSADLQALNQEVDKMPKNCRVQVLPICWRHLLDFPKQSLKHNRKEHDLGDLDFEDDEYPNLDDITVEGVPAVRNLITDLALDILLYQSPAYKSHITRIVLQESNRIYQLFKERNSSFKGRVSLIGHSLGSAIMFDIVCHQKESRVPHDRTSKRRSTDEHAQLQLDFEVEDFFALGSPIGLFQMLKGRKIAARQPSTTKSSDTPSGDIIDDPFLASGSALTTQKPPPRDRFEITTSSPKCQRVFNIFHPTDPISYRIEPLISPAMSALKPQPLPYTKKGIFGAPVGQGLTGIGARVGQSVSGLWTSFSSGIASSLLNRSLGISAEDAGRLGNPATAQSRVPLSMGAGTNVGAGVIPSMMPQAQAPAESDISNDARKRQLAQDAIDAGEKGDHPPVLIDSEMETLYAGFEKRRKSHQSDHDGSLGGVEREEEIKEIEERGRKLRREEAKVRALNANGRVDYSIQEGAFDISLIASIASHLSYWADEDVSHFMISQLLARHRVLKRSASAKDLKV
ncbi:hypothetical protein W97_03040 [Coniosporium apollinis CBS 100218]|uniref:DDHD domain-containing protein n=1 Tax=Coniosporium apollinis (strain CBS 100218) TaxID=1168221 RepID=R7YPI6_CONA1|nr:uncharacterized protein W97_03040 [Coniosporium apollinis CBS 100218]EON63812.1 hypothetical protein W97_03040 [Coniosporium apollinis CBS 100218]